MSVNMCDGCQAGFPLVGGMHVDEDGSPVMVCQRSRYDQGERKFKKSGMVEFLKEILTKK